MASTFEQRFEQSSLAILLVRGMPLPHTRGMTFTHTYKRNDGSSARIMRNYLAFLVTVEMMGEPDASGFVTSPYGRDANGMPLRFIPGVDGMGEVDRVVTGQDDYVFGNYCYVDARANQTRNDAPMSEAYARRVSEASARVAATLPTPKAAKAWWSSRPVAPKPVITLEEN